jgi:hypothetical protein
LIAVVVVEFFFGFGGDHKAIQHSSKLIKGLSGPMRKFWICNLNALLVFLSDLAIMAFFNKKTEWYPINSDRYIENIK